MFEVINTPLGKALLTLPFVILGNSLFGAVLSDFKNTFNRETLKTGLIKGTVIYVGILIFSFVSLFSSDLTIDFNDGTYTLIDAMYIIIWATIAVYGKDGIMKLAQIFNFSVKDIRGE